MKTYIGVKVIEAKPKTSRRPCADQSGAKKGGVIYEDAEGYEVRYPDGYVSWSPKDVFEEAYVEVPADSAEAILSGVRRNLVDDAISAASEGE